MARVVMFVLNDVRRDARVLREAATLAGEGHDVTVIGRPADPAASAEERESRNGFEVRRVPIPGRVRRRLLDAGGGRRGGAGGGGGGAGPAQARLVGPGTSLLRGPVQVIRTLSRLPVIGSLVRGLDLLVRWRWGTEAWGRAAADAAPIADIWHAHDLNAMPAALAARARHGGRVVFDAHELYLHAGDTATRPGWARAILRGFERRAIREADAVIAVNEGLAAELRRTAQPKGLVVVHNAPPAPTEELTRDGSPLRAAAGVPTEAFVALYHGSFAPGRGVEVLAAALREPGMADVHAVFLGDGAGRAELERLAREDPQIGPRIHVLPPVEPDEVVRWVAGADVAVMPIAPTTLNHRLSTPNKLFEALAAGVPVVASDFPGIRAIVRADPARPAGILVDPERPGSVANAVMEFQDMDPPGRETMRAWARAAATERWSWERESSKLVELYRDLAPTLESPPVPQRVTFVLASNGAFDSRTRRMASTLAGRGHDVLVIARAEDGLPAEDELVLGARLVRVRAGDPVPQLPKGLRGPARAVREAIRLMRTGLRTRTQAAAARAVDRPADLYHAMAFLALPVATDLARRAGAPFVYDARDLYAEANNIARLPWPLRALFARRERRWAHRAAAVLTVNEALADELASRLDIDRPSVVLNAQAAWSPPEPPPDRLRAALGLAPGTPLALYHGGLMGDRGLPELVEAMRSPGLDAAHLAIMGDGALRPELERLAAAPDLGGRVHLLPPVPPSELLEWVASADVGVMPNQPATINERLSTPNKLFECLAAGTPVVSSDFPERRRIVIQDPDGPLGALCDPTDPRSIGAAIRSILDLDPAARADLRARCRRAATERYSWEAQVPTLLAVYGRVTGKPW